MSDQEAVRAIAQAGELVPALTERLNRLGLGEIEVRHGDLRVRVSAAPGSPASGAPSVSVTRPASTAAPVQHPAPAAAAGSPAEPGLDPITAPAVGHFVYAEGLGPGLAVSAGSEIGFVEMLGIRHEVRAVADGVVRHLVAESGEPVEYGQVLVELDPAAAA